MLCNYGCGKEATIQLKNGKWCCSKSQNSCEKLKEINSILNKGRKSWNTGKNKDNDERLKRMSKKRTGVSFIEMYGKIKAKQIEIKKRNSMMGKLSGENHPFYGKHQSEETKRKKGVKSKKWWRTHPEKVEEQRQLMLNGWSSYMNSKIKNPSKSELKLRGIVKEFYPNCKAPYPILNYVVDIALVEEKIAIEYDGWYHFNCQESIDYHNMRQKKIEQEGWKFVRYNIFKKFPSSEKVKNNILKTIRGE